MSDEEVTSLLMFKDRKGESSRQVLSKPCMVLLRWVWLFGRAGGVRLPSLPAEKTLIAAGLATQWGSCSRWASSGISTRAR
jgi:hypothetical protein